MKYSVILLLSICFTTIHAQVDIKPKEGYQFDVVRTLDRTEVKSQGSTGTCWSFATSSFLESEMIRSGNGKHDLSEMFVVKNIYKEKARNYVLRQGKANFSQGSLAHDVINAVKNYGLVPEIAYTGMTGDETRHNHSEMAAALKGMLDGILKQKRLSPKWGKAFDAVTSVYMGEAPEKFEYDGKKYDPATFAKQMGIQANNYLSFTSYTHHPFYESFILEIPDNFSNGSFYNLPIDDLQSVVDLALEKGMSIAWDGDVSEKGFNAKEGIAVLPTDAKRDDLFTKPGEEMTVSQALRQETFESYATTDDHLMHIVGTAKDQDGTKYYLIKNSWGEISPYNGLIYMSEAYFRLKTVAVLVHKDAVPAKIAKQLSM